MVLAHIKILFHLFNWVSFMILSHSSNLLNLFIVFYLIILLCGRLMVQLIIIFTEKKLIIFTPLSSWVTTNSTVRNCSHFLHDVHNNLSIDLVNELHTLIVVNRVLVTIYVWITIFLLHKYRVIAIRTLSRRFLIFTALSTPNNDLEQKKCKGCIDWQVLSSMDNWANSENGWLVWRKNYALMWNNVLFQLIICSKPAFDWSTFVLFIKSNCWLIILHNFKVDKTCIFYS